MVQIDTDELIDATQVAAVIRLANPRAVSVYRRRYADFPPPVVDRGRCVLWRRTDVEDWAGRHHR